MPRAMLHIEGAAIFAAAILVYSLLDRLWWPFLVFILAPDLSAIAYIFGARTGSFVYNLVHTTAWPILLGVFGWWLGWSWSAPVALIWLAHIGMDRMVGYGLKYPDSFKHNHLQEV